MMVVGYMRWVLLLAPFCRGENGGSERFSLLLKVTQLLSDAEMF